MTDHRPRWTRAKAAGLVLVICAFGYLMWSQVTTQLTANRAGEQAEAVADPVDSLCEQGGPLAVELARRGACSAAAQIQESPAVAPVTGPPGERGRDGADGQDGQDGRPGEKGSDGTTPPCLAEPGQCRGADGTGVPGPQGEPGTDGRDGPPGEKGDKGDKGEPGEPGPSCPDGYQLRDAVITADDGSTYRGKACVDPNSGTPPSTTTTRPPLLPPGR